MLYDALIIGGGPAGSTTAAHLRRRGRSVAVLERERFPRFHIGESLLPYNMPLIEELGLLPEMEKAGFIVKHGAQFALGSGQHHLAVSFARGSFTEHPSAYQVQRSTFDEILLRNAAREGADIRESCSVHAFRILKDHVEVDTDAGPFHGRFLVDASGTANFTGNIERVRAGYPHHRKVALFGHFHNVALPEKGDPGDIVIVRLNEGWFWMIPLAQDRVSIGLVLDAGELKRSGLSPEELFEQHVQQSDFLEPRLRRAERSGPLRRITDFSYVNQRLAGERLIRAGDAAGFLDPIFSSGVYLAMLAGKDAAALVDEAIASHKSCTPAMRRYEKTLRRRMKIYWRMIEAFYTRGFIEVLLQPEPRWRLPCAVNAILAGRLDEAWKVRWRLELFFLLVALQQRFRVVSRLRFS
ncbi:MAG TPA: NAD(P)/FAD-dependent oxidoreductase [Verrucomicrobiales bacterium]|nr:NAD(P)/FAD-dependent oxidoreductase [Verrucomicrobiales bacterium]